MFRKILYLCFCTFLMVISARGNVFPVAAGTDGISSAVTAAASGDTIQLITSGGLYIETATVTNSGKSITIMAAPGLGEKPVWACSAVSTTGGIVRTYTTAKICGIILDGTASATSTTNGIITSGTTTYNINISDCIFRNFTIGIYGSSGTNTTQVDSVIITNSIFTKISGQAIIFYTNTNAPGSVKNLIVSNSTFYHIGGESMYVDASDDAVNTPPDPKVVLSHCTFYDTKRVLTHYCDYTVIKDCIFQNPATRSGQNSYYIYGSNSSCTYSLYYNASMSLHTAISGNLINKDAQFKDTANANFMLMSTSPAINAGSDGSSLGDPRWWPRVSLSLTAAPEGYYNSETSTLRYKDTLTVQLKNAASPYASVDSVIIVLDSLTLTGQGTFFTTLNGTYYVVVKGRSLVETWSALPVAMSNGSNVSYDFTSSQSQAYGDNQKLIGSKWCIFTGDVNQDGYVDPQDISLIDQDSFNYVSGEAISTDVNGDKFVDPQDMSIVDQNSFNYVGVKCPVAGRRHHLR